MKTTKNFKWCIALLLAFGAIGNVCAESANDLLKSFNQGMSTAQEATEAGAQATEAVQGATGAAAESAQAAGGQNLVDTLTQKLGVTNGQAEGGAGAIFQVAKDKLSSEDFQSISQAVPGMDGMLDAAPKASSDVSDITSGL